MARQIYLLCDRDLVNAPVHLNRISQLHLRGGDCLCLHAGPGHSFSPRALSTLMRYFHSSSRLPLLAAGHSEGPTEAKTGISHLVGLFLRYIPTDCLYFVHRARDWGHGPVDWFRGRPDMHHGFVYYCLPADELAGSFRD